MPLVDEDLESNYGEIAVKPAIEAKDTSTHYVTEPKVPVKVRLEGSQITCTFFNQILDNADHPQGLDLNKSPALQQYLKVINFVMVSEGSLEGDTDQNAITEVNNSATCYPTITPNIGDMFTAAMGDRRIGLFIVTAVKRSKYYNTSAFDIEYALFGLMNAAYETDLTSKTIETLYFDPNNPYEMGRSAETLTQRISYVALVKKLLTVWFNASYDLQNQTVLVPNNLGLDRLYDPEVVRFLKQLLPSKLSSIYPKLGYYAMPKRNGGLVANTVWAVLIDGADTMLPLVSRNASPVPIAAYRARYMFSGNGYMPFGHVLVPEGEEPVLGFGVDAALSGYVFSEAFYAQEATTSPLERLVLKQLQGDTPTHPEIIAEIEAVFSRSPVERFYRIPVLVWLLLLNM